MNDLTVLSVVENDRGLIDLMIRSVKKYTDSCPKIILCDQGHNGSLLDKYSGDLNIKIVKNTPALNGGSNRHGSGIMKLMPLVGTTKVAIIESDCIVLQKGWDDLADKSIIASCKAKQLYHVCYLVANTNLIRGVDFRPGTDKTRSNRPYKASEDVGWRLKQVINPLDVRWAEFVDCKTGKGKYFGSNFQSDEFWLDGWPVVAHYGRGSFLQGKRDRRNYGFKSNQEQLKDWIKTAEGLLR